MGPTPRHRGMRITRRRMLAAPLAGPLIAPLAAPFVRPARAAYRSVTFAGYTDTFQDIYQATVFNIFRRAHPDIEMFYYPILTSTQALTLLRTQKGLPQFDVVLLDVAQAKQATDENLLETVTPDSMPVLRELVPQALIGGVAGPALLYDDLVLLYGPDRVPIEPKSWRALWDGAFAQQIAIDAPPDMIGIALTLVATMLFGGPDWLHSIGSGLTALGDLAKRVQTWDPKPDIYSYITDGYARLGVGWRSFGQNFAQTSKGRLAVAKPEEGTVSQVNTINLVRRAQQPEAGRLFMALALGAEAQRAFTEQMEFRPSNRLLPTSTQETGRGATRVSQVNWLDVALYRDSITEEWRRRVLLNR